MMNKTSNVVVKNEFTNTNYSSRGSTPAQFVTEYTSRDEATLTVYPVSRPDGLQIRAFDNDSKLKKSIERLEKDIYELNKIPSSKWGQTTSLEGRAFDKDSLSMSSDRLIEKADLIQNAFDKHHTVHKIVVSFSTDYLIDNNILRYDRLQYHHSLKPAVDELKLRDALQKGCQYLADQSGYVVPEFIGSVQLDQMHAHGHIVLCETADYDLSNARRWYDGREYGTFTDIQLDKFRDCIEQQIELTRDIPFLTSYQHLDYEDHLKEYEQLYANIDITRDIILSSAEILPAGHLNHFSTSYGEKLETGDKSRVKATLSLSDASPFDIERIRYSRKQHVVDEISSRKNVDSEKVERAISSQLTTHERNSELSPFLSSQLFDVHMLRKRKSKVAKIMAKVKDVQEQKKVLQDRFDVSTQGYLYFRKLQQEFEAVQKHEEVEIIESKIIPYYENRCGLDAFRLDRNSVMQFQPIELPSDDAKLSFKKAESFVLSAKSSLDRYISKKDYFIEGVKQFKAGHLHADDFSQIISATKDGRLPFKEFLPDLRATGSFSKDYVSSLDHIDSNLSKTFERLALDLADDGLSTLIKYVEEEPYYDRELSTNLRNYLIEVKSIKSENSKFKDSDTHVSIVDKAISIEESPDNDISIQLVDKKIDWVDDEYDDHVVVGLSYGDAVKVSESIVSIVD